MKIACSMIALNEEQYIGNAIESIAEYTDVLTLVDGGSTDKTVDLARGICKKSGIEFILKTKFWNNDFACSRNESLSLVPSDVDWWFRIDADETFGTKIANSINNVLLNIKTEIRAVSIKQVNLVDVDQKTKTLFYSAGRGGWETHPRFFRNLRLPDMSSAWRWTGQVHEYCQLLTKQGLVYPENVASWNVSSIHWGWLSQERRSEREDLYEQIPGSHIAKGSLTKRSHTVKTLWKGLL